MAILELGKRLKGQDEENLHKIVDAKTEFEDACNNLETFCNSVPA